MPAPPTPEPPPEAAHAGPSLAKSPELAPAPEPTAPATPAAPGGPPGTDLPIWFRVAAIGALVMLLAAHIIIDIFVDTYEGNSTSLMLGGIVGTALGLNEFLRGRQ